MRRRVGSFTDMGKVRVPPLPAIIVMTDRADGTLYKLVHNGTFIGLDTEVTSSEVIIYGADQGPIFSSDPTVRLLVRSGALGYETVTLPTGITDIDGSRLLTRRGVDARTFEIIIPAGTVLGVDALGYEEVTF